MLCLQGDEVLDRVFDLVHLLRAEFSNSSDQGSGVDAGETLNIDSRRFGKPYCWTRVKGKVPHSEHWMGGAMSALRVVGFDFPMVGGKASRHADGGHVGLHVFVDEENVG